MNLPQRLAATGLILAMLASPGMATPEPEEVVETCMGGVVRDCTDALIEFTEWLCTSPRPCGCVTFVPTDDTERPFWMDFSGGVLFAVIGYRYGGNHEFESGYYEVRRSQSEELECKEE